MAKYRGRKIAGVSIANPRRVVKKVARARAYPSFHCSDDLKDGVDDKVTISHPIPVYVFLLINFHEPEIRQ